MSRKVIILTDPGQDEAAAILMMLGAPDQFDVLGLVATAGNISLDHTVRNCLQILELAGRPDIPVYIGCERPILRKLVMAEHVHGPSGMDGPNLPPPRITARKELHGIDFIIETLRASPAGEITICTLSPLTTLAMALIKAPDIAPKIREIVSMAGAYFEVGNITPSAEFNIYVDPEAADIVLRSGVQITFLPLDVTHQMLSTPERLAAMRATGTASGLALAAMLEFSQAFDLKKYGWPGAPLHGPCVPAFLMASEHFEGRRINVTVETSSALTLGMTVCDWWRITERERNVFYVRNGNANVLYQLLMQSLSRLP